MTARPRSTGPGKGSPARPPQRRGPQDRYGERRHQQTHRLRTAAWAAGALAAAALVTVLVTVTGHRSTTSTSGTGPAGAGPSIDTAALPGLQSTPAPWQPEYAHLPARLADLHLPANGDESFHIHAHLAIFVDDKPVTVPANVGISIQDQLESPMHTHDTSGVIHIEAGQPSSAFTLGAFFDLWGVTFTDTQLGSYRTTGRDRLTVYLNGKPLTDPTRYPLRAHDNIVVDYGATETMPSTVPFTWPAGE